MFTLPLFFYYKFFKNFLKIRHLKLLYWHSASSIWILVQYLMRFVIDVDRNRSLQTTSFRIVLKRFPVVFESIKRNYLFTFLFSYLIIWVNIFFSFTHNLMLFHSGFSTTVTKQPLRFSSHNKFTTDLNDTVRNQ